VDNIAATIIESLPESSELEALNLVHCLARLSEVFMTKLVPNPEQPGTKGEITQDYSLEGFEEALYKLKKEHFPNLEFPNPFPNEFGIKSSFGLVSYRALQALYQALLVKRIFRGYGLEGEVIEIGGGVGRTAHWLTLLDMKVTVVDLPLGLIAQAVYLSQTIGEPSIQLPFEKNESFHKVSLIDPSQFMNSEKSKQFCLALNVDSFTEMNPQMVNSYLDVITRNEMHLLSINHEVNDFTVGNLIKVRNEPKLLYRSPYWMRSGYTEDFFKFTS
jgi:hypothetical protein